MMRMRLHSRLLAIVRGTCATPSWLRRKGGIWLALTDRANRRCGLAGEERAQATVEMAVVVPVLLVLALIVYNIMLFVAATARFDRIAPDIVAAHAVSPSGEGDGSADDGVSVIESQIEGAMAGYDVEIEVTCTEGGASSGDDLLTLMGGLRTYRCSMRMRPWPSSLSIAGVDLGAPVALAHHRDVTVDPWRPGVVM